jgi:hypothetical protein
MSERTSRSKEWTSVAKAKPPKAPASSPGGRPGAPTGSKRAQLASFEEARKKEARRRTIGLLVVCVVLAAGLLAYPVYLFVQDSRARGATLASIGLPVAQAGCEPVTEKQATGSQDHVAVGTKVDYTEKPPSFGQHYDTPAPFTKRFYTAQDRPAVETLVHNLEHGYTVAWYRADAPADVTSSLEAASKTFTASEYDNNQKFIAAPWSAADGAGFPEGKNVVLARWTANPANPSDPAGQKGIEQACTGASGQAIADFMAKYPVENSPEPNGA